MDMLYNVACDAKRSDPIDKLENGEAIRRAISLGLGLNIYEPEREL